jgi:hypothetical protein
MDWRSATVFGSVLALKPVSEWASRTQFALGSVMEFAWPSMYATALDLRSGSACRLESGSASATAFLWLLEYASAFELRSETEFGSASVTKFALPWVCCSESRFESECVTVLMWALVLECWSE